MNTLFINFLLERIVIFSVLLVVQNNAWCLNHLENTVISEQKKMLVEKLFKDTATNAFCQPLQYVRTQSTSVYDSIDVAVAQQFGLNNSIFDQIHTFYTITGTRYDIHLAVAVATDTIPGSALSGYGREQNLSPIEMIVLTSPDSLPNTCFSVFSITNPPEVYELNATNHWIGCGYFPTSTTNFEFRQEHSIFPNPFSSELNISGAMINSVRIFELSGLLVYENINVNNNYCKIHKSDLKPGMYFIRINDKSTYKVIKK